MPNISTRLGKKGTRAIVSLSSFGLVLVLVLAGAGALGTMAGGWPRPVGVLVMAGLLVATELLGPRAQTAVNVAVVPLIAATCVAAAVWRAQPTGPFAAEPPMLPWGAAAVLYVAYNLVLGVAGLCASADPDLAPRDAALGGLAGGAVLGVLCAAIAWVLQSGAGAHAELPLGALLRPGPWRSLGYPATVLLALWTTGAATVRALGERVAQGRRWPGLVAVGCALPFAGFSLVGLVSTIYPVLGFVGLPLVIAIGIAAARDLWPLLR